VPQACTVCSSEHRDAIEDAFLAGTPKRRIASHHGVTERAVRHHEAEAVRYRNMLAPLGEARERI